MKIKKIVITMTAVLMGIVGCREEELELLDPNVIVPETFFQNSGELQSAVNSAYSFLQVQGMYGRIMFFLLDNMSQENLGTDQLQGPLGSFILHNYDPSNGLFNTTWQAIYRGINSCNFVLEAAEEGLIQNVSQDEINTRLGEVRFLRALYYFYLANLWGGVPRPTTTEASENGGVPKSSQDEVYELIFEDLVFAVANLPEVGSTPNGRATRGAAQALKGKAHLFRGEYAQAKAEFEAIQGYTIVGVDPVDNGNIAGEFNSESIFEVNYDFDIGGDQWGANGRGIREATFRGIEYSPLNFANIVIEPRFFALFEEDDPRFDAYFYSNGSEFGGQTFPPGSDLPIDGPVEFGPPKADGTLPLVFTLATPAWRKYQNLDTRLSDGFEFSGINFRVIRYADVLLMLAEAENELGNQAAAINLLNRVRDRVEMPNYGTPEMDARGFPVNNQQQVFEAIVHERAVELAGEQIRYFDLKRWGLADDVIVGWQPGRNEFLPIPQNAIDSNPDLSNADQNPGY